MENIEQQQQNQEGSSGKKTQVKFDQAFKSLLSIIQGPAGLKAIKVETDEIDDFAKEIFREEKEAKVKQAKEEVKQLIKDYTAYETTMAEEQKRLDKIKEDKQKLFIEKSSKVFNLFRNIDELNKRYAATLSKFVKAVETPNVPSEIFNKESPIVD